VLYLRRITFRPKLQSWHWLCRGNIDYENNGLNGSVVYVAAFYIAKACDKVNHYKLFASLIEAGLPK